MDIILEKFNDIRFKHEQKGGGILDTLWTLFLALIVIVLIIVVMTFTVAYLLMRFLKTNALTAGLTGLLCGFASNSYIVLLSGLLELITAFVPPVGVVAIPILKVIDTFGTTCDLLDPATGWITTVLGVVSLLPIGGAFGKFAKFYMKL